MNTEIRLAAELVYNKELRYSTTFSHALVDNGAPRDRRMILSELVKEMGILSFSNALIDLHDAGMDFASILIAMDEAIRKRLNIIQTEMDEEVQA